MWSDGTSNRFPLWPMWSKDEYNPFREVQRNQRIFAHRERQDAQMRRCATLSGETVRTGLLLVAGAWTLGGLGGLVHEQTGQALLLGSIGLVWLLGRRHGALWYWLCRQAGRRYGRWVGHLALALVLSGLLAGCVDAERWVGHLHGYQGDALPNAPCSAYSASHGWCTQREARP